MGTRNSKVSGPAVLLTCYAPRYKLTLHARPARWRTCQCARVAAAAAAPAVETAPCLTLCIPARPPAPPAGPPTSTHTGGATDTELSEADLALLSRWVNPAYLNSKGWSQIGSKMEADGSVQLQRFLLPAIAAQLGSAAAAADVADGVGGGAIPDFTTGYSDGVCAAAPCGRCSMLVLCVRAVCIAVTP